MTEQRYLLVVSGPSGVGKDTVVRCLMNRHAGIEESISATTRAMREGEQDGQNYYYLTRDEFEEKIKQNAFVEYAEYAGNYYGTLKSEVDKRIKNGITCVLVIEVQGAADVKKIYPGCTTVFITAPSLEEHERRLRGRGTETEESISRRMEIAKTEMAMAKNYDFCVENDTAEACADKIYTILQQKQSGQ